MIYPYETTVHLKQADMPELKLKQLAYETGAWKRLLDFISEENIRHKNRVSEILQDRFDKNLLEEVDGFQGRFIKQDDMISLLRDDIEAFMNIPADRIMDGKEMTEDVYKKLKRLRSNMQIAEESFGRLRTEFNHFLVENIL